MSRRGGRIRTFSLNAKIGRDTPLIGEMRTRVNNGRPVLYFETNDAGALFRFTDIYPAHGRRQDVDRHGPADAGRLAAGWHHQRQRLLDPRREHARPRGRRARPTARPDSNNIEFTQARADFARAPGRMTVRDGVLRGPMIGATVEGNIDYVRDQVPCAAPSCRSYGLNNMFGQIPIVGLFLGGGSNEGLFGITYEVGGPTSNPRPMINPISAIAPGCCASSSSSADAGPPTAPSPIRRSAETLTPA